MQTRTFLFADLRDYTRFVENHGDAAAATLIGDYRRLVRAEVARHEGAEVKTEGDSFYVVFSSAQAALRCGSGILREAEQYSAERPDRPMRVGVGIHAGEPQPHEGQFVGQAVVIAARLAQQSEAGELLVTEIVRGLLPRGAGPVMTERESLALKGIERAPRIFGVAWQRAAARPRDAPPAEVAVPARPPPDGIVAARELIGRERELAALGTFLDEARNGQGRLVLIAGEAGLGKSALVRRFLEGARDRTTVLIGECTEIEARRPFGPIVDSFEAAGLPLPREFGAPGPGAMAQSELDRYRIHAAFVRGLRERSASGPLLLVIEDVHWADEGTLEFLEYLPRQIRSAGILVVATYRSDELHRRHPLHDTLAELERGRLSSEIRLAALDEDGTARIIASALGLERSPTMEFRRAIHERCGGNPFFTEEVLRALVQRGDISYSNGSWRRARATAELELPRTISAAVDQRLRQLTARSLTIIRTAAVIGPRFDFELLADVTGAPDDEIMSALREAVDAQLIVEVPQDGAESYRFRHALTREAVVSELLRRERRSLHQRIAAALESRAAGAAGRQAEEIAYHFDEAGNVDKTITYRRLAATHASRALAFRRAQEHLDRAVELARADLEDLARLHEDLAEAAFWAGDLSRAVSAAEGALAVSRERGDQLGQGAALTQLARLASGRGDRDGARELLDQAVDLLEPLGATRELARAFTGRSMAAMNALDPHAAELADSAVEMAKRANDVWSLAIALNSAGTARGVPDGIPYLRESLEVALRHDLVEAAARAYNNLGWILFQAGRSFQEWHAVEAQGLAYAREHGLRTDLVFHNEAYEAYGNGDWDEALRVIDEGSGTSLLAATRSLLMARILVARSGPPAGLGLIATAREQLVRSRLLWSWGIASANTRYLAGDAAGAIADARPALEQTLSGFGIVNAVLVAALLAADELDDTEARQAYLQRALQAPRSGPRPHLIVPWFAEGFVADKADDRPTALACYEQAAAVAEEWRAWFPLTFIRLRKARLLSAAGELAAARAEFDHFMPFWRKAKATWYLGELEKKAKALGIDAVTV